MKTSILRKIVALTLIVGLLMPLATKTLHATQNDLHVFSETTLQIYANRTPEEWVDISRINGVYYYFGLSGEMLTSMSFNPINGEIHIYQRNTQHPNIRYGMSTASELDIRLTRTICVQSVFSEVKQSIDFYMLNYSLDLSDVYTYEQGLMSENSLFNFAPLSSDTVLSAMRNRHSVGTTFISSLTENQRTVRLYQHDSIEVRFNRTILIRTGTVLAGIAALLLKPPVGVWLAFAELRLNYGVTGLLMDLTFRRYVATAWSRRIGYSSQFGFQLYIAERQRPYYASSLFGVAMIDDSPRWDAVHANFFNPTILKRFAMNRYW
jgi:hypothetical protein